MRKIEKGLLYEGILSFGLALLMFYAVGIENSIYLLFLPFDLIGKGLRWLSLSSVAGNISALLLYLVLSLAPVLYMIIFRVKAGVKRVDILLPVISLYSFYMNYEFINPGFMLNRLPEMLADVTALPLIKLSLAIIFYALCIGYMIFRMLDTVSAADITDKSGFLCKQLQKLLVIVSIFYTFFLGYFSSFQLFEKFRNLSSQNSSAIDGIFVGIAFLLEGLPVIFTILILIKGILLLSAIMLHHMEEEEIIAATRMGLISKRTVYVTIISNIALNVLQFLFTGQLNDTNYSLEISLFPLIIAFSAMILSGFFREVKDLHEDNEMII